MSQSSYKTDRNIPYNSKVGYYEDYKTFIEINPFATRNNTSLLTSFTKDGYNKLIELGVLYE